MSASLQGLRILNTRPKEQAYELSQQINKASGIAINYPTLLIKEPSLPWLNKLPPLQKVTHALFTSANAVIYCFDVLKAQNISWPKSIYIIAIGKGTAKALQKYHITVHELPKVPDSEHILDLFSVQQLNHNPVLLFKGEGGRTLIEESLISKGVHLITLNVYQRTVPPINYQFTNSLWQDDAVDIILLTSEQSIYNLFKLFNKDAYHWLQNKWCVVISERLAKTASKLGIKKVKISHPNRIIDTLLDYKDCIHGE